MFLLVSVILSTVGGLPQCMLGYCHTPSKKEPPPEMESPPKEGGTPPKKEAPPANDDPPRPTPKGENEGDHVQAHTQGRNWGGSDPGPHPRGKLRGIRSRAPPPKKQTLSGQYASYWNAFLFTLIFTKLTVFLSGYSTVFTFLAFKGQL